MKLNRISLGVIGSALSGHDDIVIDFVRRYTPSVFLVMDNDGLAAHLCDVSPETLVIHRRFDSGDYLWWNPNSAVYKSPQQAVDHATNYGRMDKRVAVQILNEPAAYGVDIILLCNWLIEVGRILSELGYRSVLGNIGAAIYPPDVIESGYFDAYLRYMADEAKKPDGHLAGWHEYTFCFLPFGTGLYSIDDLKNVAALQQPWKTIENLDIHSAQAFKTMRYYAPVSQNITWPYPYEDREHRPYANWWLIEGKWATSNAQTAYPNWWHILRFRWFEIYAEQKGIGKARVVISEGLHDDMPDLGPSGIKNYLQATYGMPPNPHGDSYAGLRGPCTLEYVWRAYWPSWTFEQAAYEQYAWMNAAYPDNVLGVALFGNAWNNEWPDKNGYGLIQRPAFLDLMIAHKNDDPHAAPPEPDEPDNPPPTIPDDPLPPPFSIPPWAGVVALAVAGIAIVAMVLIIISKFNVSIGAQIMQPDPTYVDLYAALSALPIFQVIGFGIPVVYYLMEVWKRLIDPRIPMPSQTTTWGKVLAFFIKPSPVALFVVLVFVLSGSYHLAGTLGQGETFQQIAEFLVKLINSVGQYLLPTLITQVAASRFYDHNREKGTAGFGAASIKRN